MAERYTSPFLLNSNPFPGLNPPLYGGSVAKMVADRHMRKEQEAKHEQCHKQIILSDHDALPVLDSKAK
jgi:hypothetical protein